MDHLTLHHIITILGLYLFLFVSYYGWGTLASRFLGLDLFAQGRYVFYSLWIGWCFTLLLFQFIHLFSAIDWKVSCIVYLFGILLAEEAVRKNIGRIKGLFNSKDLIPFLFFMAIVLPILIWVAFRGMRILNNYDSGLYHLNFIRWINSFPIIPGLGNLHSRLGFNQSFFVYVASLNFFPYFPYAHSVANGFLFLLVIAEITFHLTLLVQNWRTLSTLPVYSYAPYVFSFFLLLWVAISGQDLSSPTPDLGSFFIQIILFLWFIEFILAIRSQQFPPELAFSMVILSTTLITIKFSNLVFASTLMAFCIFYAVKFTKKSDFLQRYSRIFVFLSALFIVWVVRGYYLSGYPLYPASVGGLPFQWTIPVEIVKGLENIIYSWARTFGHPEMDVPGTWAWLSPWFANLYIDYKINVIYPICMSLIFFVLSIVIVLKTGKFHLFRSDMTFLSPILASLLFWFFSAPDPRFAHALFFLLLLATAIIFLSQLYEFAGARWGLIFTQGVVLILAVFIIRSCSLIVLYDFRDPYTEIPRVALIEKTTLSGVKVYIPANGTQCWDAPLPCTPYYDPKLRLLIDGDLSSGFTVK